MHRAPLLLIVAVCGLTSCSSDAPLGPSLPTPFTFFVTSTTSVTGNFGGLLAAPTRCASGWRRSSGRAPEPGTRTERGERNCRTGTGRPMRATALAAVRGSTPNRAHRGEQRGGAPQPHGKRRGVRGRARSAHQRAVDRFAGAGPARHPHRFDRGRHAAAGLTCGDWTSDSLPDGPGRPFGRTGPRRGTPPAPPRPGTRRTSTRAARTRHRAAAPDASTVSRASKLRRWFPGCCSECHLRGGQRIQCAIFFLRKVAPPDRGVHRERGNVEQEPKEQ